MRDAFDAMPNSFFSDLSKPRLCVPGVYGAFNLEHSMFGDFWHWVGSFSGAVMDRGSYRPIEVFA